jgi:biopolymer transport protein ExbD
MQPNKPAEVQSAINVTPLVDVVLVLLIIFMVIAPQLQAGPNVQLPETDQPPKKTDDGRQILVALEWGGTIWLDGDQVTAEEFPLSIQEAAEARSEWKVVLKGDARLTFGEVKQAMLAVEAAGFKDIGLIAERRVTAPRED